MCGSCGYEVMVSGKDDLGFFTRTTTILCEDCEELYDVVTSRRPGGPGSEGKRMGVLEPECPKSTEHAFRRWTHPDEIAHVALFLASTECSSRAQCSSPTAVVWHSRYAIVRKRGARPCA